MVQEITPIPRNDVHGLYQFLPQMFVYALLEGRLPIIPETPAPTWSEVVGLFPISNNITPALTHPFNFAVFQSYDVFADNVQHGPYLVTQPGRYRHLYCPKVLIPLLEAINHFSPPNTLDHDAVCLAVRDFTYSLVQEIYKLIPEAARGHPAHLSRFTRHPRGPFRLYSFRASDGRITESRDINVRPATYWLAHSILAGFAVIWARPGYGPGVLDLFTISTHVVMTTRFLLMRQGTSFQQQMFDGAPSPTGLWLLFSPEDHEIVAI
jgi:hypothetical protein